MEITVFSINSYLNHIMKTSGKKNSIFGESSCQNLLLHVLQMIKSLTLVWKPENLLAFLIGSYSSLSKEAGYANSLLSNASVISYKLYFSYASSSFYLSPLWNWQGCNIIDPYNVTMLFHNGRREFGVSDLRERIDRAYSPKRGYSPARDVRGRHTLREYSPSRSLEKESKRRKRQHLDDHSDYSGNLRIPNEPEDEVKEAKSKFQKQLQGVQSELKIVEQHRSQLEVSLGERSQEVDSLTSKIQELEAQLYKEKEECTRISHKVKKFVKAHSHHSRIQEQLKRSQVRLNKLGEQLGLDTYVTDANEEDASINIVSDGDTDFPVTLHKKRMIDASPIKKRLDLNRDPAQEPKQAALSIRRSQRLSRWNMNPAQSNSLNGNDGMSNGIRSPRLLAQDVKHDRKKVTSSRVAYADASKSLESGPAVPSTSMAAHAVDTEIDIELDGKLENVDIASRRIEGEPTYESGTFPLPLPPPPPFPPKNFSQPEGNDETVEIVDGVE